MLGRQSQCLIPRERSWLWTPTGDKHQESCEEKDLTYGLPTNIASLSSCSFLCGVLVSANPIPRLFSLTVFSAKNLLLPSSQLRASLGKTAWKLNAAALSIRGPLWINPQCFQIENLKIHSVVHIEYWSDFWNWKCTTCSFQIKYLLMKYYSLWINKLTPSLQHQVCGRKRIVF